MIFMVNWCMCVKTVLSIIANAIFTHHSIAFNKINRAIQQLSLGDKLNPISSILQRNIVRYRMVSTKSTYLWRPHHHVVGVKLHTKDCHGLGNIMMLQMHVHIDSNQKLLFNCPKLYRSLHGYSLAAFKPLDIIRNHLVELLAYFNVLLLIHLCRVRGRLM